MHVIKNRKEWVHVHDDQPHGNRCLRWTDEQEGWTVSAGLAKVSHWCTPEGKLSMGSMRATLLIKTNKNKTKIFSDLNGRNLDWSVDRWKSAGWTLLRWHYDTCTCHRSAARAAHPRPSCGFFLFFVCEYWQLLLIDSSGEGSWHSDDSYDTLFAL
jgi:hypothetical protein